MAMIRVGPDPTAYGLIFTDDNNKIERFLEKPSWDEATVDTVNAGIYVIDPSVFRYVPQNEAYSFERGLFRSFCSSASRSTATQPTPTGSTSARRRSTYRPTQTS